MNLFSQCACHQAVLYDHNIASVKLWSMHAVKRGDRIAQRILERIVTPEVEEVTDLDVTVRGCGGYGSTGH